MQGISWVGMETKVKRVEKLYSPAALAGKSTAIRAIAGHQWLYLSGPNSQGQSCFILLKIIVFAHKKEVTNETFIRVILGEALGLIKSFKYGFPWHFWDVHFTEE